MALRFSFLLHVLLKDLVGEKKGKKKEKMQKRLWVLWRHLLHPSVAVLKPSI